VGFVWNLLRSGTVLIETSFLGFFRLSAFVMRIRSSLRFHSVAAVWVSQQHRRSVGYGCCGWVARWAAGKCSNAALSLSSAVASAVSFVHRGGEHTLSLHLYLVCFVAKWLRDHFPLEVVVSEHRQPM
jgi:hypothetical protein